MAAQIIGSSISAFFSMARALTNQGLHRLGSNIKGRRRHVIRIKNIAGDNKNNNHRSLKRASASLLLDVIPQTFNMPTLVSDKLYLGSAYNAADRSTLQRLNIGAVVNVACEVPTYHHDLCEYLHEPIWDDSVAVFETSRMERIISFISDAHSRGLNVLVHCVMGQSRSVAVVSWYISSQTGCTLEDAVKQVERSGRFISLNVAFLELH